MVLKSDRKEQLSPYQFYQDEVISVPGAEKIISVLASARVSGVSAENGELRVSYRLHYKVIYKGASEIDCVEETAEKQTVIRVAGISPKTFACVEAQVISTEYVGTTSLKVRLSVEMTGYYVSERSWDAAEPQTGWQVKSAAIMLEHILAIPEKEIVAEREFEMKEGLGRVLTYDTQVAVKTVRAGGEIAEVEGECYTYLTYVNDSNLLSRCLTTPFHAEILVDGMKEDSPVYLKGRANSTTITQPDGEGSVNVRLEIVVGLTGYAINRVPADVMCDVYSVKKELKCSCDTVTLDENLCLTGMCDRLNGTVRLEEDQPRVRSVLCVCPPSVGAVSAVKGAEITVEGVVACDVIYLTDGDGVAKVLAEIPYRVTVNEEFTCTEHLHAAVMAFNLSARARHNDEIEINGELSVELFGNSTRSVQAIGTVEEGNDKEENDAAISLYLVHPGEELWDVAKALGAEEETLLKLNPDIELPLIGGEKILMYRPLSE